MRLLPVLAVLALSLSRPAAAGQLDAHMNRLAKEFARAAKAGGVPDGATLAVLPFQAEPKLRDRGVGRACSEVLMSRLMEARTFRLIERAQLDAVLEEQKFGQTGAVAAESAARLGLLLGARLVSVGSVSRLGSAYHMSAELVDVETGEILAAQVAEVDTEVFEEEAKDYVRLVPDTEALGLYMVVLPFQTATASALPPVTRGGTTITPLNPDGKTFMVGIGVRYFPWSRWMFDLAYYGHAEIDDLPAMSVTPNTTGKDPQSALRNDGPNATLTVNRLFNLGRRLRGFLGGGASLFSLNDQEAQKGNTGNCAMSSGNPTACTGRMEKKGVVVPMVRAGLEFKPARRLGLSVFANYSLSKAEFTQLGSFGNSEADTPVWKFALPSLYYTASLAFYF